MKKIQTLIRNIENLGYTQVSPKRFWKSAEYKFQAPDEPKLSYITYKDGIIRFDREPLQGKGGHERGIINKKKKVVGSKYEQYIHTPVPTTEERLSFLLKFLKRREDRKLREKERNLALNKETHGQPSHSPVSQPQSPASGLQIHQPTGDYQSSSIPAFLLGEYSEDQRGGYCPSNGETKGRGNNVVVQSEVHKATALNPLEIVIRIQIEVLQ